MKTFRRCVRIRRILSAEDFTRLEAQASDARAALRRYQAAAANLEQATPEELERRRAEFAAAGAHFDGECKLLFATWEGTQRR